MAGPAERPWLAKYPAGVPPVVEVPDRTLPEMVAETVREFGDHTALIYYGKRWTYRTFWAQAGRFAQALAREGLKPGDRCALYLPNCPAHPIAFYGALRLGLTVVPVSPLFLGQDLLKLLRDADPRALVTTEFLYPNLAKIESELRVPTVFVARLKEFYPFPKSLFVDGALRRKGLVTGVPTATNVRAWPAKRRDLVSPPPVHQDPASTVAVLQYTGGTTGLPKAAMLTHRNLVANAVQCRAWFTGTVRGQEVILLAVPLFHIYGLTAGLSLPFIEGNAVILQTRPDVDEILRLIGKYHPTQFPGVPALYNAIAQNPKRSRYDLRSIRRCISGSAPLPQEVQRRFEELTGAEVVEGYGLSETSPVTHVNPFDGERRVGSVGLPVPDTEQRVVDLETGTRVLPPGEDGELCVRGPQVMLGYYRQPAETRQAIRDGWFYTGDIAHLDPDGYCYIVDRKKDMINVGGLKVYPREVEEVLFQHPEVADAAVVGVPNPELGEVPKAFVVRKPGSSVTSAELIDFVRERIAHFKGPRSVEFVTALPRSGVQKVLRRELRRAAGSSPGTVEAERPPPAVTTRS